MKWFDSFGIRRIQKPDLINWADPLWPAQYNSPPDKEGWPCSPSGFN
jgi:hypothetical protein